MAERGKTATTLLDTLFSHGGQDDAAADASTPAGPVLTTGWKIADDFFAQLSTAAQRQLQEDQRTYEEVYADAMEERYRERGYFS